MTTKRCRSCLLYTSAYRNTNYQYNASAPQPPEGADPIRYFLTESKQGYSVQFASAAVVMFRMFGLPARYVVGLSLIHILCAMPAMADDGIETTPAPTANPVWTETEGSITIHK